MLMSSKQIKLSPHPPRSPACRPPALLFVRRGETQGSVNPTLCPPEPPLYEDCRPLPSEEVRRLAESEGLPLIVAPTHTGFKGVSMVSNNKGNQMTSLFALKINKKHAGSFATAEQAALAYSRHIGREAAVVEAAAAQKTLDRRAAVQTPEGRDMTVAEAEAVAAAEGLTLERSETHASGFKNVHLQTDSSRFFGRLNRVKVLQVGTHATPQAVALAMARQHRRDTEAAAAAAPSAEGSGGGGSRGGVR